MFAESEPAKFSSPDLGQFSALNPYIKSRNAKESSTPLPDLPVPDEFKQVFHDWAERKVNFVADSPDPE